MSLSITTYSMTLLIPFSSFVNYSDFLLTSLKPVAPLRETTGFYLSYIKLKCLKASTMASSLSCGQTQTPFLHQSLHFSSFASQGPFYSLSDLYKLDTFMPSLWSATYFLIYAYVAVPDFLPSSFSTSKLMSICTLTFFVT